MIKIDKTLKKEDKVRKENCEEAIDRIGKSGLPDWKGFKKQEPQTLLVRGGSGQVHVGDVFRAVFPTLEYCRSKGIKIVLASSGGLQEIFKNWSDTLKILDASRSPDELVEALLRENVGAVTKWGRLHREWRALKELEITPSTPFLHAPADHVAALRNKYEGKDQRRVLGIIWRTSMIGRKGGRDASLEDFKPLLTLDKNEWNIVSLQYGDMDRTEEEISEFCKRTGLKIIFDRSVNPMRDYAAATAQMATCDHIVSIDCSQIFQAGASSVPVSVLLPHETAKQWEEFADKNHPNRCPFFPETAKLFRQEKEDDWSHPIEKATRKLIKNSEGMAVWYHAAARLVRPAI